MFCTFAATIPVAPSCADHPNAHEATPNLAARCTRHDNRHQEIASPTRLPSASGALSNSILARGASRQHLLHAQRVQRSEN